MEPGGLMPHSQELSNNPYPEPNQPNSPALIPITSRYILILSSHLRLGLPKININIIFKLGVDKMKNGRWREIKLESI